MAINSCRALQGVVAVQEFEAEQNEDFYLVAMHAKMALDYGIDVTVAATEFMKLDMMGSAFLRMELQTKARNIRDNCT